MRLLRQDWCVQSSAALLATYETAHNSLKDDTQSRVIARQTQAHSFFRRLPEIAFRDVYQTILSQDPLLDTPIIFSTKKNALQMVSFPARSAHLELHFHQCSTGQGFARVGSCCATKNTIKLQLECGRTVTPS